MAFPFSHFPLPLLYTRFLLSSPLGNLDLCRLASVSFITQFLSTKAGFCPSQFLSWRMAQFPLVTVFYAETLPIKVLCLSWFYWANILLLHEVLSFSTLVWSWHPSISPPPNSLNTDDLTLSTVYNYALYCYQIFYACLSAWSYQLGWQLLVRKFLSYMLLYHPPKLA